MQFSEDWLRQYVNPALGTDELAHALTMAGLEVEDVVGMVKLNFKGRVEQHNGDFELAPNVTLHHVGGHTPGLQIVRVMTKRGWVVLASDAHTTHDKAHADAAQIRVHHNATLPAIRSFGVGIRALPAAEIAFAG